ncbi:precorrin-8X methylmutase [Desulfosporosinus acididurans]|uniref:Precorrin-8X methylmutase n=1 Tax=Desulfosporosinus acididurans TaxID=476652 RepID=A0A0J1IKV2_9FIRM|nr:precorrin-8X methylmutase [Desulfosporosinus acididurans]KLU65341.1 precorrin-8X methylmutase [Desulfosporosinus acididurans]
MTEFILDPQQIEAKSMSIIRSGLTRNWLEKEYPVVERLIHTSGDPSLEQVIAIHPQAIDCGLQALKNGSRVITDVEMVRAGIAKEKLKSLGGSVECYLNAPEIAQQAKEWGITRSMTAFRMHPERLQGAIIAVGNAPTALLEVLRLAEDPETRPALIIGIPVGFVGAKESKDLLWQHQEIPSITVLGTRGGSPLAATVVNALIYTALRKVNEIT